MNDLNERIDVMDHKIWDCHVHLFPNRLFKAIFRWFDAHNWIIPYNSWSYRELQNYLESLGVERAFLLTYAHKADISMTLNQWVRDFCRDNPMFIPFACIHPDDHHLERNIETVLDEWDFVGFKLQLAVQGFSAADPRLKPIYHAAEKRGKPVIIHTGTAPYQAKDYPLLGIDYLLPVLKEFPELKVLVPHFGLFEMEKTFALLADFPNLYLDTSWAMGNPTQHLDQGRLQEIMQLYPQRFLYGSDFPIMEHDPKNAIDELMNLGLSHPVLGNVLKDNAMRLIKTVDK
ncbi:amidohydrolase family protein [Metallumcola ferriviriculae]|uniref:Amidohydrolase family protein n=1 Tax=Metallumcola ferriviriculae TaxID=3039180 RepID=A0AAU0USY8_9FIRM|nr:amidohydrolase family protein [Desulfitibacteraceae bacterium MK1]